MLIEHSNTCMLKNRNAGTGDKNIKVSGGIWDMNHRFQRPNPAHFSDKKKGELSPGEWSRERADSDPYCKEPLPIYSGFCMMFFNVAGLTVSDITIENPVTYGIDAAFCENFTIENIHFDYFEGSPKLWNMDGIHIEGGKKAKMKLGVDVLPVFKKDNTDRNRTSPFAFTGNKFEFRMLGSSNSIACANIMLNGAVAETLEGFADRLEKAEDFDSELHALIKETVKAHERIIFNGNGYGDEWMAEAEKRGLSNLKTTADAMPKLLDKKNVEMLMHQKIFTKAEIESRYEIMLENYVKTVNIEALTMVDMAKKEILPAIESYVSELLKTLKNKSAVGITVSATYEKELIEKLSSLTDIIYDRANELEKTVVKLSDITGIGEEANFVRDSLIPKMAILRVAADEAGDSQKATSECFPRRTSFHMRSASS